MAKKVIYVTGPFGAPIMETAEQIAKAKGLPLHDLDREVEIRENWSVKRMVMMHGEHCYRNAELDALKALQEKLATGAEIGAAAGTAADAAGAEIGAEAGTTAGVVVACGDGILYDEDSRAIIETGQLVICGMDMSEEELWERALKKQDTYHAFMSMPAEEGTPAYDKKRERFHDLIGRQKELINLVKE